MTTTDTEAPAPDEEIFTSASALAKQLGTLGVTDAHIGLRLAHTLISKGYAVDFLPTSSDGDAALTLFLELTPSERLELGDIIARKAGHDVDNKGWPDWLHKQLERAEMEDEVAAARKRLNDALSDTLQAMTRVNRAREELIQLYDVEIAEGSDLFPTHLAAADLALRTADALNPVKEG